MAFNTVLAFVPVVLVVVLRQKLSRIVHFAIFLLWLLFLPNTIYLITDLQHMGAQLLRSGMGEQLLLIFQYVTLAVLGVVTYVYGLEPISTVLKIMKVRQVNKDVLYILLNFLVAFGVILGKVQRTHSWYVFTQPQRVVDDVLATFSDMGLMVWVFFIGVVINSFFFLFRKYFPPLRPQIKSKRSR